MRVDGVGGVETHYNSLRLTHTQVVNSADVAAVFYRVFRLSVSLFISVFVSAASSELHRTMAKRFM